MKSSGHWYKESGEACHTIEGKNGKPRPTTIRDARNMGLYPSVTTVLSILAKPQLDEWKFRQITEAAWRYGLPTPDDDIDSYHANILDLAFAQVDKAADLGTRIHEAIERHFRGFDYDADLRVYVEAVDKWVKDEGIEFTDHELRLVNKTYGYAGTTDAAIKCPRGHGILDFKSRRSKRGIPMTPWDSQAMQIAAYHAAKYQCEAPEPDSCGCNLFISTTEPGRVEASWYSADELSKEWNAFLNVLCVWKHFNRYDPARSSGT